MLQRTDGRWIGEPGVGVHCVGGVEAADIILVIRDLDGVGSRTAAQIREAELAVVGSSERIPDLLIIFIQEREGDAVERDIAGSGIGLVVFDGPGDAVADNGCDLWAG